MKRLPHYITICLLLFVVSVTMAQQPFSKDVWLNETNVPVKVNCLRQDNNGHIWLGTDAGLYSYNGRTFTLIAARDNQPVTALATRGDKLYVGFSSGAVGIWDGEDFKEIRMQGKQPRQAISDFLIITNNVFLLSTVGEGFYLVHNNYCTQYNMDDGLSDDYVYTLFSPANNTLLATTDQGINEITLVDGAFKAKYYTTANNLPDNIVRVVRPIKKNGWSWVGTHQGGVALYCSKSRQVWVPESNMPWQWGQINDIWPVGDDMAWVCTEEGYLLNIKLNNEDSMTITPHHYPGQRLYNLLMDKTGNLWCATNAGLKEIVANYMTSIKLPAPFALQELTAMTCDKKSELWLAQKNKVYSCALTEQTPVLKLRYTSDKPVTQLYCDKNGVMWAGTFGDGLWYSTDHEHFKQIIDITPLQKESILDIAGTGDKLWVAGLNGVQELAVVQNSKLLHVRLHNKNTGIGSDYVYKIFPDSRSNIWMATDGAGVCMYKYGKYKLWDSAGGMTSTVTYNITEDKLGQIWASTFNKGLLVYGAGRWNSIGREHGLQSLKITALAPQKNGGVLVVHAKGIDEWHEGSQLFRHYERRLGVGIDTVSTTLNMTATDTAGNVYIPYQDGMVRFGQQEGNINITPDIYIKTLNTFFTKTHLDKNDFNYSENHITFQYEGINFANPEQLFYRYKLEGYNEEWIITRDESVTFPQLPSGDYKFVIQVSMSNLFSSYGEEEHSFSIAKPYWQQWWFLVLSAGLVWFVAYTYIRIREGNLRKLSALQKERMMFEYEHLKSQVNPHFLFNSLNTLTGLIDENKEGAMQYTTQLSDLYRNMLSHKDKDLITLGEEWEILDNYIYIQKSRFGDALQLVENVPEKLKKNKRIVPMALQLLLENAIKHNIVSQAKPLTITFDADENELIVRNNYQPKMSKEKGAGLGLANIRKRYALHTKAEVTSRIDNNEFIVTIPLI